MADPSRTRARGWGPRSQGSATGTAANSSSAAVRVLDRCFAAAAERHSTGFLLASLENPPDPSVLKERIYPAAIKAFAASPSPQVLALLEKDDSPLGKALKEAIKEHRVEKKHNPPAEQLARGRGRSMPGTCAACHQSNGTGVTRFPATGRECPRRR